MIVLALMLAIAVALFYLIVFQTTMPGSWKFALCAIEMIAFNQVLIRRYKMPSELGLVLLKSKKGIEAIDKLARNEKMFNFMADVGSTMSYGLLSLHYMKKNATWKSVLAGLLMLGFLTFFVTPVALSFLLYIIGLGSAGKSIGSASGLSDGGMLGAGFLGALLLVGGLFLLVTFGVIYYGLVVFKALVMTVFFGTNAIATTNPGGDILLPGVNLPFFEGIAALIVVLAVHEVCHAVLARIAKIQVLSSGIVLFGIIPIGAFVEPDE